MPNKNFSTERGKNRQSTRPLGLFPIESGEKACFHQPQLKICRPPAFNTSPGWRRCYDVGAFMMSFPHLIGLRRLAPDNATHE
ncbi:hypothetical protein [Gibbsiella quercinecans]|uniref:hypothetical protein n=1 Tax=Gibbsiella quercinecans TaxID=929813 RepID=UPI0011C3F15E|nr:hypothetical protein [Gibbsiella quercinecans]